MWSHVLYTASEDDVSAIQWCEFCLSLSGSLLNILSESETSTMSDGINYTGDLPHHDLDRFIW